MYPVIVDGEAVTESMLKKKKATACRILTMSIHDNLINIVTMHIDSIDAWRSLKEEY